MAHLAHVLGASSATSTASWTLDYLGSAPAGSFVAGVLLVDEVGGEGVPGITVDDTAGNTYTVAVSSLRSSTCVVFVIYTTLDFAVSASTDLNVQASDARSRLVVSLDAFDDEMASADPLDQIASTNGSSGTVASGTTPTTSSANQLLVAGFGFGSQRTLTAGSGWTTSGTFETAAAGGHRAGASEYRYVSATGTYSADGTLTSSSGYAGAIATFELATAPPDPEPVSVTVEPADLVLAEDQTYQLAATLTYDDASTEDVTATAVWDSDNDSAATVSSAGLVTAVAAGDATVSATVDALSDDCDVTVTENGDVGFRAIANGTVASTSDLQVVIPATIQQGDFLVLIGACDSSDPPNDMADPPGWQLRRTLQSGRCLTKVWTLRVTSGLLAVAGSTVQTTLAFAGGKAVLTVIAYSGANDIVFSDDPEDTSTADHVCPTVTVPSAPTMVLRAVAVRVSSPGNPVYPGGHTGRVDTPQTTGGGAMAIAVCDIAAAATGPTGTATITVEPGSAHAVMYTIALVPTPDAPDTGESGIYQLTETDGEDTVARWSGVHAPVFEAATVSAVGIADVPLSRVSTIAPNLRPGRGVSSAFEISTISQYVEYADDNAPASHPIPSGGMTDFCVRLYLRVETLATHEYGMGFLEGRVNAATAAMWRLYVDPTGRLSINRPTGSPANAPIVTASTPIPLLTWMRVELTTDGTLQQVRAYVGDTTSSTHTNIAVNNAGINANTGRIRIGNTVTIPEASGLYLLGEVAVADTADLLGPPVRQLAPVIAYHLSDSEVLA